METRMLKSSSTWNTRVASRSAWSSTSPLSPAAATLAGTIATLPPAFTPTKLLMQSSLFLGLLGCWELMARLESGQALTVMQQLMSSPPVSSEIWPARRMDTLRSAPPHPRRVAATRPCRAWMLEMLEGLVLWGPQTAVWGHSSKLGATAAAAAAVARAAGVTTASWVLDSVAAAGGPRLQRLAGVLVAWTQELVAVPGRACSRMPCLERSAGTPASLTWFPSMHPPVRATPPKPHTALSMCARRAWCKPSPCKWAQSGRTKMRVTTRSCRTGAWRTGPRLCRPGVLLARPLTHRILRRMQPPRCTPACPPPSANACTAWNRRCRKPEHC
mmetsp:Transcript_9981/g.25768  ORF Transcript_9981/g.25768 Transcript_9981/m.25768 type:complete len:330 (-) Transcript_9981:588-1577(-)